MKARALSLAHFSARWALALRSSGLSLVSASLWVMDSARFRGTSRINRTGIGPSRFWGTRSIYLPFLRSHLRRDGPSLRLLWCRNVSGEVFANRPWKQCFRTPDDQSARVGSLG